MTAVPPWVIKAAHPVTSTLPPMSLPRDVTPLDDSILSTIAAASAAPLALLVPPLWQARWVTPTYANLHGLDAEALQGHELRNALLPTQWCQWQRPLDARRYAGADGQHCLAQELPFGPERSYPTRLQALYHQGQLHGVLVQPQLELDLSQAHQLVQQSDARMRKFAAATSEAILFYDRQGHVLDANDAAVRLSGYPLQQLQAMTLFQLAPPHEHAEVQRRLTSHHAAPFNTQLRRRDGLVIDVQAKTRSMPNGDADYSIVVLHDISAHKRAEARVNFLSHHDPLTQLPNRNGLQAGMQRVLAQAAELRHAITVGMIDLDRFKDVNDSLGHAAGDRVLREVGRRLRSKLHPDDLLARIGSDEFAVVLGTRLTASQAHCFFSEIQHALAKPFTLGETQVSIPASIGTSRFPEDGQTADELLQNAHAAMCHAKETGQSHLQHYSRQLAERPSRLLALEQQLREAVERDQLVLHYQPQWDVQANTLAGFEALVRWQHPQRGLLPPGEFIPFAESRGLIALIGRWVMRAACRQMRQWQTQGYAPVPVAVNMSALEFRQPNLLSQVEQILTEEQVAPQWLEIELTESTLMKESDSVLETLQSLKRLGVQLAIDDFGTGYSSLAYLRRYPLDKLKIDRSFLRDVPGNSGDVSLVTAIIQMARSLKLRTVAEGVETAEQLDLLSSLSCEVVQGFHIARPMPADAAAPWQPRSCHTDVAQ